MTQTLTHQDKPLAGPQVRTAKKKELFGTILQFVHPIAAELRKVATPTRKELFRYTSTVVAFDAIMILFITLMDLGFSTLSSLLFKGSPIGDN